MKKYLFICLMAAAAGLTSCSDKECTCKGHECTCTPVNKVTLDLKVIQQDWQFDNGANMYFYHFDVPELTTDVYNYGELSISREYNNGTPNAYQVALPETTYMQTISNGNPYYFQQHIDYAYGVGFVEIFVTLSDLSYAGFIPESMIFRLQMTY